MADVAESLTNRLAWVALRAVCRIALRRVDLRVEGLEHVPATGPAVIAARHFHHFYDGAALLTLAPRPLRIVVALDWVQNPFGHRAMSEACRAAGWPVVPRPSLGDGRETGARLTPDARRILRISTRESVSLLRAGRMLLIFPEGYPNVDPVYTPKADDDDFLPFRTGFLRLAALAERDGRTRVPIVPVGLEYIRGERWSLTVRFGPPASVTTDVSVAEQAVRIERHVQRLSGFGAAP